MSLKLHVALGFEFEPSHNWESIIPEPKKPSNWKQETFDAKKSELRSNQAAEASETPVAGKVSSLAVRMFYTDTDSNRYLVRVATEGKIVTTKDAIQIAPSASALIEAIKAYNVSGYAFNAAIDGCILYAANIRNSLRVLCMNTYGALGATSAFKLWDDLAANNLVDASKNGNIDVGSLLAYDTQKRLTVVDLLTVTGTKSLVNSAVELEGKLTGKSFTGFKAIDEANACARIAIGYHLPFNIKNSSTD